MARQKIEWRFVVGWPYEVSSVGEVRNAVTLRVLKPMRTGTRRQGSQRSKVRFSTKPRADFDVAHLVLAAFVGPRPMGFVAMHRDDDSSNNAVSNLLWATSSQNMLDCAVKQRHKCQRLSLAQVAEVVKRRAAGETGVSLAKEYGVSQQRICDVYKGRSALLGVLSEK